MDTFGAGVAERINNRKSIVMIAGRDTVAKLSMIN